MLDTVRRIFALVGVAERGRWILVICLSVLVAAFEALGTLLVFALLSLLSGSAAQSNLPFRSTLLSFTENLSREDTLLVMATVVALFFILRAVVVLGQAYLQFRVAYNTGARLSTRMLRGYMRMPYVFHLERNSSELIRNVFESVQRFVQEGLVPGVRALSKLAIVGAVLIVLLASSPLATTLAVVFLAPFLWGVLRLVQPRVERLGRRAQYLSQQTLHALQQSFQGWRDIAVLERKDAFVSRYGRDRLSLSRARYLRRSAAEVPRVAIETAVVLFISLALAIIVLREGTFQQAIPVLGLFGYAALRLMPELNQITRGLNHLKFVGPAVDDLHRDMWAFERDPSTDTRPPSPLRITTDLTLRSVNFRYPGASAYALNDVSLRIAAGESIGIVGATGCGKSTLVDLIVGLLQPTSGSILVDGTDIHSRSRDWHLGIGLVPQMPFLTDDTLRRNIALGLPDDQIHEPSIRAAVRIAQLESFVSQLSDGLDASLGENGVRLSGGQRQRLAIARAVYHQPSLLLLDEGTSALDSATEASILRAIDDFRADRTVILVAHRLTTVAACDRVILLSEGRILDIAPFDELVHRHKSLYASTL